MSSAKRKFITSDAGPPPPTYEEATCSSSTKKSKVSSGCSTEQIANIYVNSKDKLLTKSYSGYHYNKKTKLDGITKEFLPRLFWPNYEYHKAVLGGEEEKKEDEGKKKRGRKRKVQDESEKKVYVPKLSMAQRIEQGMRRGSSLDVKFIQSVKFLKENINLSQDVFALYRSLKTEECEKLCPNGPIQVERLRKLLNAKSSNLHVLWKTILCDLKLKVLQTQIVCSIISTGHAAAVDIDAYDPITKKHVLIEVKTGDSRVKNHTGNKLEAPFQDQPDSLINHYLIQAAVQVIFYEETYGREQKIDRTRCCVIRLWRGNGVEVTFLPSWVLNRWEALRTKLKNSKL